MCPLVGGSYPLRKIGRSGRMPSLVVWRTRYRSTIIIMFIFFVMDRRRWWTWRTFLVVLELTLGPGLCFYHTKNGSFTFILPHRKNHPKPKAHDLFWKGKKGRIEDCGRCSSCTRCFCNNSSSVSNAFTPSIQHRRDTTTNNNPTTKLPRISERSVQLEVISYNPLLLMSTGPVLTSEECQHLICTHEKKALLQTSTATTTPNTTEQDEARTVEILLELNYLMAQLTNCPHHEGETECPRYISYHAQSVVSTSDLSSPSNLLPDGLHLDINNGKLFRHITALLYLTDNHSSNDDFVTFGGATTFPFAIPCFCLPNNKTTTSLPLHATTTTTAPTEECTSIESCVRLVKRGIYHTSKLQQVLPPKNSTAQDVDTLLLLESDRTHIEQAATELFLYQQAMTITTTNNMDLSFPFNNTILCQSKSITHGNMGIRMTPQKGRLCIFYSWGDDGRVDPRSFHGGEAIFKNHISKMNATSTDTASTSDTNALLVPEKALLSFFKEIPMTTFQNMHEFMVQVTQSRQWALQQYSKKEK